MPSSTVSRQQPSHSFPLPSELQATSAAIRCVCVHVVCVRRRSVCVGGGKKKEPIPWAARDTDTNVSPRASIKLCRPFSCLPTTSIRRASPSPSRCRTLEMIPSVWHKSEIICSWSHPDRGHRRYWNKHWLGCDCRKKETMKKYAQWNITVFVLENSCLKGPLWN